MPWWLLIYVAKRRAHKRSQLQIRVIDDLRMVTAHSLIDTHAHLDEIKDLEPAIAQAKMADIMAIIGVGSDYESNQKVLAFARDYKDFVYPALGPHPWNLKAS